MWDSSASCVSSTLQESRHAESKAALMHTDDCGAITCLTVGAKRKRYDLVCKAAELTAALKRTVAGWFRSFYHFIPAEH